MNKRSFPMLVVSCVLIFAALAIYLIPATAKEELPNKVLLPNSGGRVVFTHTKHLDYAIDPEKAKTNLQEAANAACVTCHHDLKVSNLVNEKTKTPLVYACGACHGASTAPDFKTAHQEKYFNTGGIQTCISCHHENELPGTLEEQPELQKLPLKEIGQYFTSCTESCHSNMLGRMDTFHNSCISCHDKVGKGPKKDQCKQCHTS
ncbi:cytochrome c3 family protein [Desulfovibrio litoralis]|uniref:Class III cytochrome C domain-containing protein n=1 Tax=Desulfovibrio litoralis DSM 11393 TaxID=1121455 RepID=A0A1M7SEV1_9BACT|nr:cytochrome c3 family protein [Desulfovibrio litoralis]SHN56822.1 hypothetical protein SAMN02745728_00841 [Desulfovibrio litoralis DSM 11393]